MPVVASGLLLIAIGVTAILPEPLDWKDASAHNTVQYYQVATSDYVTPFFGSPLLVTMLNAQGRQLGGFGGYDTLWARVTVQSGPKLLSTVRFVGNIFHVAGIKFLFKRSPTDDGDGVYISESVWDAEYGKASNILEQSLTIGDKAYAILGVTKSSSGLFDDIDLWIPIEKTVHLNQGACFRILTRLKAGVALEEGQTQIIRTLKNFEEEYRFLSGKDLTICPVDSAFRPKYASDDLFALAARKAQVHKG